MMSNRSRWSAFFLVAVVCVSSAGGRINAAATDVQVKAGELVIDPPTLINLGFEWVIHGDDNRNAKVEVSYRKKGDTAWKTACRCCGCRVSGSTRAKACSMSRPTCSPAPSSIWRRTPPTRCAWRSAIPMAAAPPDRHGQDPRRADAGGGRPCLSRLSARLERRQGAGLVQRPDVRLQLLLRRRRHRDRRDGRG